MLGIIEVVGLDVAKDFIEQKQLLVNKMLQTILTILGYMRLTVILEKEEEEEEVNSKEADLRHIHHQKLLPFFASLPQRRTILFGVFLQNETRVIY